VCEQRSKACQHLLQHRVQGQSSTDSNKIYTLLIGLRRLGEGGLKSQHEINKGYNDEGRRDVLVNEGQFKDRSKESLFEEQRLELSN